MSYLSYKPQVRQEGFHLPNQNRDQSPSHLDPTAMFMLPDSFRKFPAVGMGNEHGNGFDFSDELAQLMAGPNAQSMQQVHTPNYEHRQQPFDDAYRHTTHNIFDISAPLSASHHSGMPASLPTPVSSMSNSSHYPSSFALQTNRHNDLGMLSPPNSLQQGAGPLAEFSKPPSMFNSTLPALNSSMRFEPPPVPAAPEPVPQHQAAFQLPPDFRQRQTPSPPTLQQNGVNKMNPVSRSRSRTRAPSNGPGPTRTQSTTRAKRNSVSSASPPPRPHPSAILIPGTNGLGRAQSRDIAHSPLSLSSAGGWFAPEFGLPTPDSMNGHGFGLPGRDGSLGPNGIADEPSPSGSSLSDAAAKQAAIANEKRRRRRESHNAVERRRRDNINEKIGELATLIPECMLDANAPANFLPTEDQITGAAPMPTPTQPKSEDTVDASTPTTGTGASDETAAAKANKGMILRKSVDYIRYLQQLVGAQASRNRALQSELANYRSRDGTLPAADGTPGDEMGDLVLHDSMNFSMGDFSFTSFDHSLPAVREMDIDDVERPDTALTLMSSVEGQSPSVDGDSDDYGEEEERGRRDRHGRVAAGVDVLPVQVKTEGTE